MTNDKTKEEIIKEQKLKDELEKGVKPITSDGTNKKMFSVTDDLPLKKGGN